MLCASEHWNHKKEWVDVYYGPAKNELNPRPSVSKPSPSSLWASSSRGIGNCHPQVGTGFSLSTADPGFRVCELFQNFSFISKGINKIFALNMYINFVSYIHDLTMESIVYIASKDTLV